MSKLLIGIDNGVNGGIACINRNKEIMFKYVMPVFKGSGSKKEYDIQGIIKILNKVQIQNTSVLVILEKAQAMMRDGKTQAFKTGYGFGVIEGVLVALKIPYEVVAVKTWQRHMLSGISTNTKTASIQFCKRQWPDIDLTATEKSRKDHDGMSDALCIAEYGRRYLK
jgi:hypothetical protein